MDGFDYLQVVENPTEGTRWLALERSDLKLPQEMPEEGLKDFMRALGWEFEDRWPSPIAVYMFRRPKPLPLPPEGRVATSGPQSR
jgi:hypothetical protein